MTGRILRRAWHAGEWVVFRLLVLGLLAAAAGLALAARYGVPGPWAQAVLARIDTGDYAVEVDRLSLVRGRGVCGEGLRVYRRGRVGPPAVEAGTVRADLDVAALCRGRGPWRRVTICDAVVRPPMFAWDDSEAGAAAPVSVPAGEVVFDNVEVYGVTLTRGRARVRGTGARVILDPLRVRLRRGVLSGTAEGRLVFETPDATLHGRLGLVMNPHLVLPVIEAWNLEGLAEVVRRFQFEDATPQATLAFTRYRGGARFDVDGVIDVRDGSYRGAPFTQAGAAVRVTDDGRGTAVRLGALNVAGRRGGVQGDLAFDLARETVQFEAVSTTDPQWLRTLLGVMRDPFWDRWRFEGPVTIRASGTADLVSDARHDIRGTFDGRGVYYRGLRVDTGTFRLRMQGRTNDLSEVVLSAYGGRVTGDARCIVPAGPDGNTTFALEARGRGHDFQAVAEALPGETTRDYRGQLDFDLALRGLAGEANLGTLAGQGTVDITQGRVFLLPVFGGLSDILARIIPGLDFVLRQSDAFAAFAIREGAVHADKVRIEGGVLSLSGAGSLTFDQAIDFHAQVRLMKEHQLVAKLLRMLTYPLTKLFEFRVRGTLDAPHWYPVNFSGDLLEKLGLKERRE